MNAPDEKPDGKPGHQNLRPPWTAETAPRVPGPGRPKGSGLKTLKDAFTAELAKASSKRNERTIAETIAEKSLKLAMQGDARHLEIAHRITGAERVELTGPNGEPLGPNVLVIRRVVQSGPPAESNRVASAVQPSTNGHANGNGNGHVGG